MSILQELEESLQSDAPIYMEFLYRYDPKRKQVLHSMKVMKIRVFTIIF